MALAVEDPVRPPEGPPPRPQPRPRRRPAQAWVLMVLAATVAAISVYAALAETDEFQRVAVARENVPIGTRLSDAQIEFVALQLPAEGDLEHLITAEEVDAFADFVLVDRLEAGELLSSLDLRDPEVPEGLRSMSLPVPPERSAGGTLRVGDRVDIISVAAGVATYVARELEVLAIPTADAGALDGQVEPAVTVAVDDATALRLAAALEAGPVHLLRATGARPAQPLAAIPVPGAEHLYTGSQPDDGLEASAEAGADQEALPSATDGQS